MGLRGRLTPLSLVVLSCRSVAALRTLVSVGFDLLGGEPQLVLIVEDECLTRHAALDLMGFACKMQGNATPSCGEAFADEFASLVSTRQLARRGGDVTLKFVMDGGDVVVRTHPGHATVGDALGDALCEHFRLSARHAPHGECERLKAYVAEAVAAAAGDGDGDGDGDGAFTTLGAGDDWRVKHAALVLGTDKCDVGAPRTATKPPGDFEEYDDASISALKNERACDGRHAAVLSCLHSMHLIQGHTSAMRNHRAFVPLRRRPSFHQSVRPSGPSRGSIRSVPGRTCLGDSRTGRRRRRGDLDERRHAAAPVPKEPGAPPKPPAPRPRMRIHAARRVGKG